MSNISNLNDKIKTKIDDKTALKDVIIEINKIKEVLTELLDLIQRRAF